MQLPRDVLGYDFAQAALVGGVDILVGAGDDLEGAGQPLLLDLGPAGLDSLELVLGQAAGLCVCAGEGDGADDVLVVADIVEGEGLVVLLHKGVEAACWGEVMVVSLAGLLGALGAQLGDKRVIEGQLALSMPLGDLRGTILLTEGIMRAYQ